LINNNFIYESEKWFDDCRGITRPLPFDFWVTSKNILIEFQGEQHYSPVNFRGSKSVEECEDSYKLLQQYDQIKRDYCLNNSIRLIEIPYWDIKNIDTILTNVLGD